MFVQMSRRIWRTIARANIWNYDSALVHLDVDRDWLLGSLGSFVEGPGERSGRGADSNFLDGGHGPSHRDLGRVEKSSLWPGIKIGRALRVLRGPSRLFWKRCVLRNS